MPLPTRATDLHLTEMEMAALLAGRLSLEEREELLRHIGVCPRCSAWLVEAQQVAAACGALPPVALYHPLEGFLAPLRRLRPWPVWVWHLVIHALTPVLWVLVVDVRSIPHLQSVFWTFAPWPASLLMTTYLVWSQGWIRRFAEAMWEAGIPVGEIDDLLRRHLAPLQGWGYGGGRLFVVLGLVVTLLNVYLLPPLSWRDGLIVAVSGLYSLVVTVAMYWSWGWGGWWWYGVAELLGRHPERALPLLRKARVQALTWLLVASLSMAWHLAVGVHLAGIHLALRVYGVIITCLLLSLWGGYVVLERALVRHRSTVGDKWKGFARVAVAFLVAVMPGGLV